MQQHEERIREIMYASAAPVVLMNTYIKTQIKNCNTRWIVFCLCLSVLYFILYINKKPSKADMDAVKVEYQKVLEFKVDSLAKTINYEKAI